MQRVSVTGVRVRARTGTRGPAVFLVLLVVPLLTRGDALRAASLLQSDTAMSSGSPPAVVAAASHATLRGWADETWLLLEDREGARDGRLSRAGILQRFHAKVDDEYELDFVSSRFSLADDFAWHARENGVRYWAGSINHRELITGGEAKASVSLAERWRARVSFTKEESVVLDRSLVRVAVAHEWPGGATVFVEGTLDDVKPNMDLGVGAGWRGAGWEGRVAVTLLDAFSDFIFQELGVYPGFSKTALDFERRPVAVRATVEARPAAALRAEAHTALLRPARMRAYDQDAPDVGFRQDEEFSLAGGLVEWSPSAALRVGALASTVRAVIDRTPLPRGGLPEDFRLAQRTSRAGVFVLARPLARWALEGWLAREWRPERREARSRASDDVDYEDRAWSGQAVLGYRAPSGLAFNTALDVDLRDGVRGVGQVPRSPPEPGRNTRIRFDVGWESPRGWSAFLGTNFDLDGDPGFDRPVFDGAHGRFIFYW